MEDAEIQFKEALYRSAIEGAYFLKRMCEGTEDRSTDDEAGLRLGAAVQLIDAALNLLTPEPDLPKMLDLELVEVISED